MTNIRNSQRFIYLCVALVLLTMGTLGVPGTDAFGADGAATTAAPGSALQARNPWNDVDTAGESDEPDTEEENSAQFAVTPGGADKGRTVELV